MLTSKLAHSMTLANLILESDSEFNFTAALVGP